jgi:crotonobetainyl-CoA:carnitine CoA-transferase CaiB-like acyl-CoA transferase
LGAPYGLYETKDGFLALAMGSVPRLGELLGCEPLARYSDPKTWFDQRDEIKEILASHLRTRPTREWLALLEPADYWCAEVRTMEEAIRHEGVEALGMVIEVSRRNGAKLRTTRCPIRVDGQRLVTGIAAPVLGEDTAAIDREFGLTR